MPLSFAPMPRGAFTGFQMIFLFSLSLLPEAEDVRNRQAQYPENAPPQIRSPADSIVANHVIIGRPGLYAKEETRSKGLKI